MIELLTPREAANRMGITFQELYRRIKRNEVKPQLIPKDIIKIPWDTIKNEIVK